MTTDDTGTVRAIMGLVLGVGAALMLSLVLHGAWLILAAPRDATGMVPPGCSMVRHMIEQARQPQPTDACPRPLR